MRVHSIFQSISGETGSIPQGTFSTFIRFQGCNMSCPWCDTPESQSITDGMYVSEIERKVWTPSLIMKYILTQFKNRQTKHIVITGGEPLLQKNLIDLLRRLKRNGRMITLETNGTIAPSFLLASLCDSIVMDYKPHGSFGIKDYDGTDYDDTNDPDLDTEINLYCHRFFKSARQLRNRDWVKFVVQDEYDIEEAWEIIQHLKEKGIRPRFAFSAIPPLTAPELYEQLVKRDFKNFVLNVQLHKLIGLP